MQNDLKWTKIQNQGDQLRGYNSSENIWEELQIRPSLIFAQENLVVSCLEAEKEKGKKTQESGAF